MSKKLETLGLIEVTSKRQADNGTVCFHDPITNCDYLSYESGYIRRRYKTKAWYSRKTIETIYQLNPTKKTQVKGLWSDYSRTERILIHNPNYRLELLARATANYRKYLNK